VTLEVSVRPLTGTPGTECKAAAANIHAILSPVLIPKHNPRSLIQLVVQSLTPQRDIQQRHIFHPSLVAACINSSMLALLNASSFPLRGVVCAVAAGSILVDSALVVDPPGPVVVGGCFAFMFGGEEGGEELVWTSWKTLPSSSARENQSLDLAVGIAREGCRRVYKNIRTSIEERYLESPASDKVKMDMD